MDYAFDPEQFGFVHLRDFLLCGDLPAYEYRNHPAIDGSYDYLRYNLYLTKDQNYVTIWRGFLEPIAIEMEFERGRLVGVNPSLKEALVSGDEQLFRGHVDSDDAARHILNALRIGGAHKACAQPQVLRVSSDKQVSWYLLTES